MSINQRNLFFIRILKEPSHRFSIIFPFFISTHSDFVALNPKEGSSVFLECLLTGIKDENIVKWLKNGIAVEVASETAANSSQSSRYDVSLEDFKLTIAEVSPNDDGIYDCALLNERREFIIKSKRRYKLSVQGWCICFSIFVSTFFPLIGIRPRSVCSKFCRLF